MSKIDELYAEWKSLLPLKESDQRRLDQKFMLEFNYNSNHLEGNTLTYGQTEYLLLFGRAINDANMRDLEDMKASNVCLQMVKEEAANSEHYLTEYFIRTLHKTLLREDYVVTRERPDGTTVSYTIHAGRYKTRPNSVRTQTNEIFEYASPEETPALMADLLKWYGEAESEGVLSPIEMAALFHYRYIRIHPFEDGNGRISRLIVNYILARHGYPMIVVKSADKENYLKALNQCDINTGSIPALGAQASINQIKPFVNYLTMCLGHALDICIRAGKGESIEEPDDFAKEISLLEKTSKKVIPEGVHIASLEDKIGVFNKFHRFAFKKLRSELSPIEVLFNTFETHYFFTLGRDNITAGGFFSLDADSPLPEDLSPRNKEIATKAQSIMCHLFIRGIKSNYNIKDISLYPGFSVFFDLQSYSFDGINYPYGTYPSDTAINDCINRIKDEVLKQLKEARK